MFVGDVAAARAHSSADQLFLSMTSCIQAAIRSIVVIMATSKLHFCKYVNDKQKLTAFVQDGIRGICRTELS